MDEQAQSVVSVPEPETKAPSPNKRRLMLVVMGILVVLVGVGAVVMVTHKSSNVSADTLFYDMLKTAAAQPRARLVASNHDFASQADYAAHKTQARTFSVAELDPSAHDYRAVYLREDTHSSRPDYTVARCLGGKEYAPAVLTNFANFQSAQQILNQAFGVERPRPQECSATSTLPLAPVSDGIIPVDLTAQQIDAWIAAIPKLGTLTLHDGGKTTYQGKSVRKVTMQTDYPGGAAFFKSVLSVDVGLKLDGADAGRFQEAPYGAANLLGFYLIDPATKLPVYSEFATGGLYSDNPQAQGSVTRYAYSYPDKLSIGKTSDIQLLQ